MLAGSYALHTAHDDPAEPRNASRATSTDAAQFSLNAALLRDIVDHAKPLGHSEKPDNLTLAFGFLYYGLVRALRPRHILVIGSGFAFSVVCLALGHARSARPVK